MSEETKKEETPNTETESKPEEAQAPAEQPAESTADAAPAEEKQEAAPAEEAPQAEQIEGKVKWFSNVKGYGFLTAEGQDRDIFVHYSSIQSEGYKTLNEAEEVSFQVIESDKGPQAANVIRKKKEAKEGEEAKS